ncbi:MAG: hypothetical protein R2699_17275 [Acidimicrobiales bacterium]
MLLAARHERGVGVDELQRRGEHVALADRQVDAVARVPGRVTVGLLIRWERLVQRALPLGVRDDAAELARQVDAGRRTEAVVARRGLHGVAELIRPGVELVADPVVVHVARHLQRRGQVDGAVGLAPGVLALAVPGAVGDDVDAVVTVGLAEALRRLVEQAGAQRRRGGDELERRTRGVQAADGAVDEGVVGGIAAG